MLDLALYLLHNKSEKNQGLYRISAGRIKIDKSK
jgi:hypothetical protein